MWNDLPEVVLEVCDRIKSAQIENMDALKLISRYDKEDTLIYCDPPYLRDIRKKNIYACEMSDNKHIELLSVLKQSKSKIILSGYDNELYNSELEGWFTDEKETTAQMGLHRTEKIWMNFDMGMQIKL